MARRVQIKDLRSGKIKVMEARYAEVLVRLKKAVFVEEVSTYSNKEMVVFETKKVAATIEPVKNVVAIPEVFNEIPFVEEIVNLDDSNDNIKELIEDRLNTIDDDLLVSALCNEVPEKTAEPVNNVVETIQPVNNVVSEFDKWMSQYSSSKSESVDDEIITTEEVLPVVGEKKKRGRSKKEEVFNDPIIE